MQKRKLGSHDPGVAAIDHGAMGLQQAYGSADKQDGLKTIHRAYKLNVTLFDTAEHYGWGENEKFFGWAVKGLPRRDYNRHHVWHYSGVRHRKTHPRGQENNLRYLDTDDLDILYQG